MIACHWQYRFCNEYFTSKLFYSFLFSVFQVGRGETQEANFLSYSKNNGDKFYLAVRKCSEILLRVIIWIIMNWKYSEIYCWKWIEYSWAQLLEGWLLLTWGYILIRSSCCFNFKKQISEKREISTDVSISSRILGKLLSKLSYFNSNFAVIQR